MFNLGILFTLAHGIQEPLRSAVLEQIDRVIDYFGRESYLKNTVSIKTADGSRTDVKDFDLEKALADADANESIWLEVPVDGGYKLICIDHIIAITVKSDDH